MNIAIFIGSFVLALLISLVIFTRRKPGVRYYPRAFTIVCVWCIIYLVFQLLRG